MPATIWKGAINFGLINIPVKLSAATESKTIAFRSLHNKCKTPINLKRWCPSCGEEAEYKDLVKGYEYEKGSFVEISQADLQKLPVKSKKYIQISGFVKVEDIDPIYFDRAYYLSPDTAGEKPYTLLYGAMKETSRAAVAKITIREKEQLCIVRVYGNVLALNTMYFPDEIREPAEITDSKKNALAATAAEADMARQIVENLTVLLDPGKFHDEYREKLMEVIGAKIEGHAVHTPNTAAPASNTKLTDLWEKLRASVEATQKTPTPPPKKARPKKSEMPPPKKPDDNSVYKH